MVCELLRARLLGVCSEPLPPLLKAADEAAGGNRRLFDDDDDVDAVAVVAFALLVFDCVDFCDGIRSELDVELSVAEDDELDVDEMFESSSSSSESSVLSG